MILPVNTEALLPQKFPFIMVDTLIECSEKEIKTSFLIPEDNVLCNDHYFSEAGLIEGMAQSAAAGTGYYYKSQGKEVPVGYIGAIKNLKILKLPIAGTQINTHLLNLHQIANATIISGKIYFDEELIASCELTIFVVQ